MNTIPTYTVALDLGDLKHALCVLNADGKIIDERFIPNKREDLELLSNQYPDARIAFEVGSHSPWISRLFAELDHEVIVANPRKLRMIYMSDRKSDESDARMLAKLARLDVSLLHPVQHGSERAQRDLLQIKLRDNLVRQRVDVISAVRFTLKSLGVRLASPKTSCFTKRARLTLEDDHSELLAMIEPSLQVIDTMTKQIRHFDKQIDLLCELSYPETARLRGIRGIGPITALAFILTIEDPHRFGNARDVGAYLGLVPKRDQSGNIDKVLGIGKCGNAYLRRLLVGCAQYLLGPFGEPCDLRSSGERLIARGGRGAKKKAAVATARKLAVVMLTVWKDKSEYHQFREAA